MNSYVRGISFINSEIGFLIDRFIALNHVNAGFDDRNILTFDISLSSKEYAGAPKVRMLFKQFLEKIESLPGVDPAAATESLTLGGSDSETQFYVTGGLSLRRVNCPWQ